MAPARLYLDRTWSSPEENLAVDEALLQWCESHPGAEVLRIWESPRPFVVLGHSNAAAVEADLPACQQLGLPVLRRSSGGGAVVQGPGCLSYALVLGIDLHPELASVSSTNRWIMQAHRNLLVSLTGLEIVVAGITDLAAQGRKFSGNAQKRARTHLLFHGTFLLGMDLALIRQALRHPSREPDYRARRAHGDFLRHLPLTAAELLAGLRRQWQADTVFEKSLEPYLTSLLNHRYRLEAWHRKR